MRWVGESVSTLIPRPQWEETLCGRASRQSMACRCRWPQGLSSLTSHWVSLPRPDSRSRDCYSLSTPRTDQLRPTNLNRNIHCASRVHRLLLCPASRNFPRSRPDSLQVLPEHLIGKRSCKAATLWTGPFELFTRAAGHIRMLRLDDRFARRRLGRDMAGTLDTRPAREPD